MSHGVGSLGAVGGWGFLQVEGQSVEFSEIMSQNKVLFVCFKWVGVDSGAEHASLQNAQVQFPVLKEKGKLSFKGPSQAYTEIIFYQLSGNPLLYLL